MCPYFPAEHREAAMRTEVGGALQLVVGHAGGHSEEGGIGGAQLKLEVAATDSPRGVGCANAHPAVLRDEISTVRCGGAEEVHGICRQEGEASAVSRRTEV